MTPPSEQTVADTARVAGIAYAAGSLRTALDHHIVWLDTLADRLSERGVTAERRRLIIEKQTELLRDVLADADALMARS